MKTRSVGRGQIRRGWVLFEIIIALTVFSVAALGLANSLNASIDAMNYLNKSEEIRRGLMGLLAEARKRPKRGEMAMTRTDEKRGITYVTELVETKFAAIDGTPVTGLWILRATATFTERGEEKKEIVEVYVQKK